MAHLEVVHTQDRQEDFTVAVAGLQVLVMELAERTLQSRVLVVRAGSTRSLMGLVGVEAGAAKSQPHTAVAVERLKRILDKQGVQGLGLVATAATVATALSLLSGRNSHDYVQRAAHDG